MIKLFLGGIGSGKTITAVKFIKDSKLPVFSSFTVRDRKCILLKWEHMITYEQDKNGNNTKPRLNWKFWKEQMRKHGGFHIVIDEMHNIMHSRRAMSKTNVLLSMWVAQIRKITGASEKAHFIVISQELGRVDIAVRELANEIIRCEKYQDTDIHDTIVWSIDSNKTKTIKVPQTHIILTHFTGGQCLSRYITYRDTGMKTHNYKSYFYANPYMQFYDTTEINTFGMEEYL